VPWPAVDAAAGWVVSEIDEEYDEVEIEFVGPGGKIEFAAALQDGQIATFVEQARPGTTPPEYAEYDEENDEDDD
jgi:hypothetical protein